MSNAFIRLNESLTIKTDKVQRISTTFEDKYVKEDYYVIFRYFDEIDEKS